MKPQDEHMEQMSKVLARRIVKEGLIQGREPLEEEVGKIIFKILKKDVEEEKAIEDEAHRLLKEHLQNIEHHKISYHKMFQKVKEKLAREKGLIL